LTIPVNHPMAVGAHHRKIGQSNAFTSMWGFTERLLVMNFGKPGP
jgi:hypothetical protein